MPSIYRKITAVLLAAVLLLTACSGQKQETPENGTSGNGAPETTAAPGPATEAPATEPSVRPTDPVTTPAPTKIAAAEDLPDYTTNCYTMQTMYDSRYGLKTALALVPYGWTAVLETEWGIVSTLYPATATIVMTSPAGDAKIEMRSPQAYVQMSRNGMVTMGEGVDYRTYNTYLNYRGAHDHNLLIASMMGYGSQVVSTQGPDEEIQQALTEQAYQYLQSFLSAGTSQGVGYEGTMEETVFDTRSAGTYRTAVTSAVIGAEFSTNAGAYFDQIFWTVPVLTVFTAATEEAWNQYKPVCDHVMNNSSFCGEFIYVVRQNGEYMAQMINNYLLQQAYNPSASDISGWDSGYRDDGSDKFINDWCDVIREQNNYVTEDGSLIKVDTAYDTVYQNGDLIYMGPDGLSPDGWTRLNQP
nr:hypothetical protein [Lachnospiraceae bacterium]